MFLLIVSVVAAALLFASTYQANYSKSAWAKKPWFKIGTVTLALVSGVLMIISAALQDRAQKKLELAIEGVSPIVFPRDIELEIQAAYDFDQGKAGLLDDAILLVTVIPRSSAEFCVWGVTHTPTEDSGLGMMFPEMNPAPQGELPPSFNDPAVQALKFDLTTLFTNGQTRVAGAASRVVPLKMTRNMPLDEYLQSQFIAQLRAPGVIRNVEFARLRIKGTSVPLHLVAGKDEWVGATVFRPTWERYCQVRERR